MDSLEHYLTCVSRVEQTPTSEQMALEYWELRLDHAVDGICTEAGELKDILKKRKYYDKPIDKVNAKEEIGDILWYVNLMCRVLGTSIEVELERNHAKLLARYPDKFSQDKALNRDLEKERSVLEA